MGLYMLHERPHIRRRWHHVKSCYISQEGPCDPNCENICVEIMLQQKRKLIMSVFHRQPNGSTDQLLSFENSTVNNKVGMSPNTITMIGGDFNCGDVDWETLSVNPGSHTKTAHETLLNIVGDHHLTQVVHEETRQSRTLDLFLVTHPGWVKSTNVIPGMSDHDIVVTDVNINLVKQKRVPRSIHLYAKADWEKVKVTASKFRDSFATVTQHFNEEEKWRHFKSFLDEVLSHIPNKLCSSKRHVPWLTNSIKRICKRKQHLHRKAKKARFDQAWARYNACKRYANKELRRARGWLLHRWHY